MSYFRSHIISLQNPQPLSFNPINNNLIRTRSPLHSNMSSSSISDELSGELSLLRSHLQNRRFDAGTLEILESVLVAKDVRSLTETRAALRELLRCEVVSSLREIEGKSLGLKLRTVEFFVGALALAGDVESCLALKYEALILRETKCANNNGLQVSYKEWSTFAKDSLDNGFYTIAAKGFESALLRIQSNNNADTELNNIVLKQNTINNIKDLRDRALALVASHSVQTQSAVYSKRKATREAHKSSCSSNLEHVASSTFRSGIRRRNMQKLIQSRRLHCNVVGP